MAAEITIPPEKAGKFQKRKSLPIYGELCSMVNPGGSLLGEGGRRTRLVFLHSLGLLIFRLPLPPLLNPLNILRGKIMKAGSFISASWESAAA